MRGKYVKDNVKDFINRLIVHIPNHRFQCVRYYGFYANASKKELDHLHELLGDKKHRDYSKETRRKKREFALIKLHYRTHLIDSFNRDPIKCSCGSYMKYSYTYNPLEGKTNDKNYRKECINEMQSLQIRRTRPPVGTRGTGRIYS